MKSEEEDKHETWRGQQVESEDDRRHRRFWSGFYIVMAIIMVGIFVVGTWRGCESRRRMGDVDSEI